MYSSVYEESSSLPIELISSQVNSFGLNQGLRIRIKIDRIRAFSKIGSGSTRQGKLLTENDILTLVVCMYLSVKKVDIEKIVSGQKEKKKSSIINMHRLL